MGIGDRIALFSRWTRILRRRSYYHLPQPAGKYFSRDYVGGYYNDLRGKADWRGAYDRDGIPMNRLTGGKSVYFPITIAQMALGCYELWLEFRDPEKKQKFLKLAAWLEKNHDERGGWINPWDDLRPSAVSNYSAMAQGEAISVLLRAYQLTRDDRFVDTAREAFELMAAPIEQGGCSYHINDDIYLEEYPEIPRNTVLNGWIFAVFGIYDFLLISKDERARDILERSLRTLDKNLGSFDSGFWSLYDVQGNISSFFYHSLHISQLEALSKLSDIQSFRTYAMRWRDYEKKAVNRGRALTIKIWQKLKNPPKVSLEP